jgi:hypothetical protein
MWAKGVGRGVWGVCNACESALGRFRGFSEVRITAGITDLDAEN